MHTLTAKCSDPNGSTDTDTLQINVGCIADGECSSGDQAAAPTTTPATRPWRTKTPACAITPAPPTKAASPACAAPSRRSRTAHRRAQSSSPVSAGHPVPPAPTPTAARSRKPVPTREACLPSAYPSRPLRLRPRTRAARASPAMAATSPCRTAPTPRVTAQSPEDDTTNPLVPLQLRPGGPEHHRLRTGRQSPRLRHPQLPRLLRSRRARHRLRQHRYELREGLRVRHARRHQRSAGLREAVSTPVVQQPHTRAGAPPRTRSATACMSRSGTNRSISRPEPAVWKRAPARATWSAAWLLHARQLQLRSAGLQRG